MKEDVIRQVREAEQRAEGILQDAQQRVETILHDARHHAVEARLGVVEEARTRAKSLFEKELEEFEPELEQLRQKFKDEAASDSDTAQKAFDAAVKDVVTQFKTRLGSE